MCDLHSGASFNQVMANSPILPIVIIDEGETIMIDDESEDEVEILESNHARAPSINAWNSWSNCSRYSLLTHQQARGSIHNRPSTVSKPFGHVQAGRATPSLSFTSGATPTTLSFELPSTSPAKVSKGLSFSRSISLSPEPVLIASAPNITSSLPSSNESRPTVSTGPIDIEKIISSGSADLCVPKIIPESQVSGSGGSILLARSRWSQSPNSEGSNIQPGTLIDLDDLENFDDLWNGEEDLQILRVEERRASQFRRKQTKFEVPQRNPSISKPLLRLQELQYKGMLLRPSKTVELADGDFLLITDIIQQGASEFTLRGNKIQRCNAMNGLLEKKLNEVCFFHEVDLDDPRVLHEQGAVEVSIHTVKKLRALRKTNQLFPACRSVALEEFRTQQDAAAEGGLTVRWKYTCTYACALDRWLNNPKERALEFLREEECTKNAAIADESRRLCWRGETIPGGAYIPELEEGKPWIEHVSKGSIINSTPEPESDCTIINSPVAVSEIGRSDKGASPFTFVWPSAACRRRRSSSPIGSTVPEVSCKRSKKAHFDDGDEIEIIRQDLSVLRVNDSPGWRDECFLDLPFSSSSGQNQCISSIQMENSPQSYPEQAVKNELLPTIDLSSSHLATPAPTGVISCNPVSVKKAFIRSPGQMLTYGDAFCGAGGTTRGAIMAGLRVMWGFDHWNHACSTWRVNFPQAVCYEMSSHEFVSKVQGGRSRKPLNVKVDILHLSPPCQYFSPAHTVDCPSDEMNVASLYAVGPVIQVAKPRIVTLEQTFGIVAVRFRKYFNSLIQMFTALGFSVRWAVVPLAQWGLPQRRYRLIIIAACPGEFLPAMPSPTHSNCNPNLLPFSTVNRTLAEISDDTPDHDPSSLMFSSHNCRPPWDGNSILPRAMTTHGGQNYHPSGKRDFTLREYAALQGFPPNHVFAGSYVKKQIGNAVPPCVAKVLFESIKQQLDAVDGVLQGKETMVID